jgi:hypothetical protein
VVRWLLAMLESLARLIADAGSSGTLRVPGHGEVHVDAGQIVHARAGGLTGEEALLYLAVWGTTPARFEPGVASPQRTIARPAAALLGEAKRRIDEWRVLEKKVPSLDAVPEFIGAQHHDAQILLNQVKWLVLSKVDGERSIGAIAEACPLPPFEAAKVVYGLIVGGLLKLR